MNYRWHITSKESNMNENRNINIELSQNQNGKNQFALNSILHFVFNGKRFAAMSVCTCVCVCNSIMHSRL